MPSDYSSNFRQDIFRAAYNNFLSHLIIPNNKRILFSGKFGIGKSHFLDKFFSKENQKSQFENVKFRPFHIYPVNYSIASNEDIFSYIKYDVINCMLLHDLTVTHEDYEFVDKLPAFLNKSKWKLLASFLHMLPKIGKNIQDIQEKVSEIIEDFKEYNESAGISEGTSLINYLEEIEKKPASVYENNVIDELITNILQRQKNHDTIENILIIDDLDRIDPEHVFRLMNVFAAHMDDPRQNRNKFGFDKILLVCDISNLRSIFSARYGLDTDFNGYIDKFYSIEVFNFDNKKVLTDIAYEVFKTTTYIGVTANEEYSYDTIFFGSGSLALELFITFIQYGHVNLRTLLTRLISKTSLRAKEHIVLDDVTVIDRTLLPFLGQFEVLLQLVGGHRNLKRYVQQTPSAVFEFQDLNRYCNELLLFLNYKLSLTNRSKDAFATVIFKGRFFYLQRPTRLRDGLKDLIVFSQEPGDRTQYNFTPQDLNDLIEEFINLIEKKGI